MEERVQIISVARGWRFTEFGKVVRALREWRPDIIHVQYPTLGYGNSWMPYFLPLVLGCLGSRVVQTWHEPPTRFRFFPNALTKDVLIGVEPDFLRVIGRRYRWLMRRKQAHHIPVASNIPRVEMTEPERLALRLRYAGKGRKMIANFGFIYPSKGVEDLLEIADPVRDTLVFVTGLDAGNNPYHRMLLELINRSDWAGKVVFTGFLSPDDVARALGAADAAIFPFRDGVATRNASFLAAKAQGVFALTTSQTKQGYDGTQNVFYARPRDNAAMKLALDRYLGTRIEPMLDKSSDWTDVALRHVAIYRELAAGSGVSN
jgi:glycosyltransferase involved in cell wall biosynthesis